jgi:diguanylate cyclase (GGDEF)-like protein/PAS domain S-box-containing protein
MLLLVGMVTVAVWRARDDRERHSSLERRTTVVSALDDARAQSYLAAASAAIAAVADDPSPFYDLYRQVTQATQEDLDQARAVLISLGAKEQLDAVGELNKQRQQLAQELDTLWVSSLSADRSARVETAQEQLPRLWPLAETFILGLEQLAEGQQAKLAAERAAADRAADATVTLFIAFGLVALAGGTTTMVMLILSVVRPLASLRKSVRAITSGDLQARAKVSGPEEVASLAHDFNEMISARGLVEYALRERTEVLAERAKELNCLFSLSDLAQKRDVSLSQMLQATTDLLPSAWQYPEAACARIVFEEQVFATDDFRETRWRQTSDIVVRGRPSGTVEVRYLDEKPECEEGPFLDAERRLINAVAERLGHIIERAQAEQALRESEERFRLAINATEEGLWEWDIQTNQEFFSPRWCDIIGYSFDDPALPHTYTSWASRIHPDDYDRVVTAMNNHLEKATRYDVDYRHRHQSGKYRWQNSKGQAVFDESGKPIKMIGCISDITDRKQAEEALQESEARYKALFAGAPEGMLVADLQTKQFRYANPAMCRMFGYTEEEFLRMGVADIHPKESLDYVLAEFEAQARGEKLLSPDLPCQRKDGSLFYANVSGIMVVLDGRKCNVGIFTDVTERKQMEEALHERARRDPLTGVLNHGAIVAELRSLISNGGDGTLHTVTMVDVDDLKATNDTYGHQLGDAVLKAVADALSRDGALVGRYGGDEFVAILPGANRQEAERYQAAVVETLAGAGLTEPEMKAKVPVVVSIGLATYPTEAARVEELIRLADSEMYAAKRQRPVGRASMATTDPLDADRTAKMLGEIVPLLTSRGELNDKLQLVAHRLSIGAGYEAVNFQVFSDSSQAPTAQNTFARVPDELVEAWTSAQRQARDVPMRRILERTHRPIIVDDPQHDQRLTGGQRELLRAAGLRSALVAPMIWGNELIGHLAVASKREAAFGPGDAQFLMAVATQATAIVHMATLVEELQSASGRLEEAHTETVMLLASAAEAHDRTTGQHLQNVRAITEALAAELGHGEKESKELGLASVLHDIGKVRVPDSILASVGRLTDEEWELMKHHTTWGAEFLAGRPGFELAVTIARSHHERWDGGGYPDGLAGEAIPETAAIVAVADSFDAIISDRPYRAARSIAAAMREIVACSGKQFSPRVVRALVRLHKGKMLPRLHRHAPEEKAAA